MADKDKENVRENLERGREDLEQGINSAFLTEEIPADSVDAGTLPTGDPVIIEAPPVYSRPSAADRIERIINRPDGRMLPSLADRAERQAFVQRARSQAELRPSLADRAEREVNLRLEQLLDPQERVKYSPAAVAQLNARLEAARKAKEGQVPTAEVEEKPLAGGMFAVDTGLNDFIDEQRAQQTVSQPAVESLKGETDRKSFVLENYPTLFAAAERAGLSDDEVRDMVNFTLAFDAASIVGNATVTPERKAAILSTMSEPMQSLVVDIVNAGIQEDRARGQQPDYAGRVAEAQEEGREAVRGATAGLLPAGEYIGGAVSKALEQQQIIGEQSTGNTGQDILRTAWNWTLGPAFDAWFAGAENIQRQVRAGMLATGTQLGEYSWEEAWKAAEKGQLSQQRLDELREMYGQKPVDLIVEVMDASKSNDPDFIGTIIQKYQDDPEMLDYLDKAINGTRNDQEFADLITSVRAAETGDIGNVAMQSKMELLFPGSGLDISREKPIGLEGYEQTRGYFIGRNTINVLSLFFLDPLLALGVARGGVLAARYGMARVALEANAPVKGTRVFQEPAVRRFMGTLGGQLNDLNRLEATEGVAAMSPVSQSLRSMYKRYFTPEALDDMRIYMRSQAKPDSDPAAVLEEYFSNIENIQHIIVGQSARRGRQVQVPHMTAATARVKLMSLKARGLTYPSVQSSQFLDEVFYPGFSQSLPEEAGDDLARILSGEGGDQYVGRALSDFTIRDGEMVRNLMGRIVLDRLPKSWGFTRRYGWRRSHTPAAIAARARRLAAIWPNTAKPLKVSDASDAGRVQQLVEAAGMPRHFGQIMREVWVASDEATRRMIGEGLARTYGYARGVDVVSDEGRKLIGEIGPGAARGDQYAASMPNMVELEGQASKLAKERLGKTASPEETRTLANEILKTELLPKAAKYNPSMVDGRPGAITLSDMTDSMAFPDINRLEPVTARSSLLTALTGQNIGMSNITDFWVLGTLAGPRFQVRNAIEDMGLFLATGGSFRQYLQGRMFSTGRREATERPRKTEFAEPKGMKLGTFKTLSRSIGNITGKLYADETAAIVLPNLSKQDIARANNLAREGNREALAKLVAKAYLRQRLRLLPGEFRVIGRTVDEKKLKPKELERLRWLEQAIEHGDVLKAMDEAAETGRHLADGFPARVDDMNDPMGIDLARNGDVVRINGQDFRIYENVTEYRDIPVHNTSNESIKAWHHNVSKILHGDGPKGQWTMQLLPRYYRAVRGGRDSEVEEIVTELAERVAGADEAWGYGTRSMIQRAGGFEALARASLDNALQLFTTRNGRFNRPLFRKTQVKAVREDGTEYTKYAMWDLDEAGERVHLVSQTDLAQFSIDGVAPMMVNAPATQKIAIPMQNKWSSRAWAAMGRSLARMTREPIFTANYLDSREVLSPFEKIIARDIGEEAAQRWAVNAATERTFRLTMNYVDNPNIRSQFAWQVRNVARFYRALEDFNRRMIRTTRNEPMAFAKIALAWNALDDSGFVWEDEFGEKYFVWPGTRQGFEAVNGIFNMLGAGQVYSPSLPLAFTSRVNMTTPSADPNALLPTFSGPYASFALLPAMKVLPGLKNLEDEFFGEYTKGRSVWETAFPSHIVRAFNFMRSQVGTTESRLNETDTVFATAARSAAVAYAAAGLWEPGVNYTDEEIALHRQRVDRTAQWIVGLKFLFAPVAFAALSLNVDTATDFAKSFGLDGMRPAFVQLLRKNEGDISAASIQWIKLNPDLSPFMVGTTGTPDSAGYYGPFEEVVRWIEDNEDAVELSPAGASFFAPIDGKQTLASWSFLAANGFKSRDSVDTYIKELMNAEGKSIYYALRSQWVDEKKAGVSGADGRWEDAKNQLFATYPRLKSALGGEQATGGRSSISDMQAEVDSIREVANFLKEGNRLDERGENIYNLVRLRDQSHSRLSKIDPYSPNADEETTEIREAWKKVLSDAGSLYPEDRQFRNLLYILSESLVENWGRYV